MQQTAASATELKRLANAIRALAIDAVQAANSGHPGMPMGMADIAATLWTRHLKHNPSDPKWLDRDRFVLSNGHGSMLLYAALHLSGYDLPMNELRQFRQLHSKTPGHPEVDVTPGVETTTGPLGQGFANAVGMAMAERLLATEFNRDAHTIVDHLTWVFAGDGCLMEGVSHEAASLAGAFGLSRLIVLFDDNGISIDGQIQPWCADNVPARFQSYGWNVIAGVDGHDPLALDAAMAQASTWAREGRTDEHGATQFAPTLIACRTQIGYGSPNRANTAKAHGEPLGAAEIAATRAALGWTAEPFEIPAEVAQAWDQRPRGTAAQQAWAAAFAAYRAEYPQLAAAYEQRMAGELPANWPEVAAQALASAQDKAETVASRKASQITLDVLGPQIAALLGGSADLTGSNLTQFKGAEPVRRNADGLAGRHVNWGVREFGMSAAMNGIALHGGFIPYGGTFLTFSDYSRNAIRMAALMRQRVIQVLTHDSIGLGEDGPTHQSVEHAASLRLIPGLHVWRPCDTVETAAAWVSAVERRDGPSALLLSRQNLPFQTRSAEQLGDVARGGYVLAEHPGSAASCQVVLIATGSEVQIAQSAAAALSREGIATRVVSMPCTQVFDQQDITYKRQVLPDNVPRLAIEAGVTDFWWKYRCQAVLGLDRYGESAPAGALFEFFGLTAERLAQAAKDALAS